MGLVMKKATKEQAKLRLALVGPSGSGKTMSSLRIATGLGGDICVIDSERGSAAKYADRFTFNVIDLPNYKVGTYVEAIRVAQDNDIPVLIIDSSTHAWRDLVEQVEKIAKAKYRGNTWSAWQEGTPIQNSFVNAILNYPGHVIVTMRTKTEWTTEKTSNGKSKPVRVGLGPEQRKGIEYEFDMFIELTPEHIAHVSKDRTGKYQDEVIEKPGEELGEALAAWLQEGAVPEEKEPDLPSIPSKTLGTIHGLPFLTDYEELRAQHDREFKAYANYVVQLLSAAGYSAKQHRQRLLEQLFETSDQKSFVVGWYRLLEGYAHKLISCATADNFEDEKAWAKTVVAAGVAGQIEWADASEATSE